jgi:hypothetical protein
MTDTKPATPLPWKMFDPGFTDEFNWPWYRIGTEEFESLAVVEPGCLEAFEAGDPKQNAEYIVHACNNFPQLQEDKARLIEALEKVLVSAPDWDAKDGPCCHDVDVELGTLTSTGCTCGNYDDVRRAGGWADDVYSWFEQKPVRDLLAEMKGGE